MSGLGRLYAETVARLERAGIDSASSEATLLFAHFLDASLSHIFLHPEEDVSPDAVVRLEQALARRLQREPLQYILGVREFWSLEFVVSPSVLVPRPETEFLVDRVLHVLAVHGFNRGPLLDMCTGSGVIAIVLARELKADLVLAVDVSYEALRVAAQNAGRHDTRGSVQLVCSDLFSSLRRRPLFELIVANPPYIRCDDFAFLPPEVRDWEPKAALVAGGEGLDIVEKIAVAGYEYLLPGGWMFLEVGADQQAAARDLFLKRIPGGYEQVEVLKDWTGRPRVLQARKRTG